ncbi:MAG: PASTA domain-containing protein [Elusimicrobia bacterium]|nr:PASTA domain-containing protein [Elusimicrobiota bacterium]
MTDSPDIFSQQPPQGDDGGHRRRWAYLKRPRFILLFGLFLALLVLAFSVNQIMTTLLHTRPEVTVPKVEGKSLTDALQTLSNLDLSLQYDGTDFDETLPAGTIIRQQPSSGMKMRAGRPIRVVISKGGQAAFVPDVNGKRLAEAQSLLAAEGIQLGAVTEAYSPDQVKGIVLEEHPSSGTIVTKGAMVDLEVSKGPPPSGLPVVPDFTGKSSDEASKWAASANVKANMKEDAQAVGAPGTVVRQEPAAGQPLLEGQDFNLTIVPIVSSGTASRLSFDVPSDVDEATVRVMARDNRGESQVYEGKHKGGSKVELPIAINTTTRFRIYVNDVLQEEKVVEP